MRVLMRKKGRKNRLGRHWHSENDGVVVVVAAIKLASDAILGCATTFLISQKYGSDVQSLRFAWYSCQLPPNKRVDDNAHLALATVFIEKYKMHTAQDGGRRLSLAAGVAFFLAIIVFTSVGRHNPSTKANKTDGSCNSEPEQEPDCLLELSNGRWELATAGYVRPVPCSLPPPSYSNSHNNNHYLSFQMRCTQTRCT